MSSLRLIGQMICSLPWKTLLDISIKSWPFFDVVPSTLYCLLSKLWYVTQTIFGFKEAVSKFYHIDSYPACFCHAKNFLLKMHSWQIQSQWGGKNFLETLVQHFIVISECVFILTTWNIFHVDPQSHIWICIVEKAVVISCILGSPTFLPSNTEHNIHWLS